MTARGRAFPSSARRVYLNHDGHGPHGDSEGLPGSRSGELSGARGVELPAGQRCDRLPEAEIGGLRGDREILLGGGAPDADVAPEDQGVGAGPGLEQELAQVGWALGDVVIEGGTGEGA